MSASRGKAELEMAVQRRDKGDHSRREERASRGIGPGYEAHCG